MRILYNDEDINKLVKSVEKKFYIYGITSCAQIFYIICLLNHCTDLIQGFLVSDINKVTKKDKVLHKKEVRESTILKDEKNPIVVICAYKPETQKEISEYIQKYNSKAEVYIFNGNSAKEIMEKYICMATEYIKKSHDVSLSDFEIPFWNVSDKNSCNFYKYMLKLYAGSVPDTRIFGEGIKLDDLHQKEIGDYQYIGEGKKSTPKLTFSIYMAKSHVDKKLAEDCESLYTYPIQVGSALTEKKICELQDNIGDNLSLRNRDYCELSALYWTWKNDHHSDYIGLCHYRRRFVLSEKQFAYIEEQKLDAVYTVPKIIDQGVEYEFVERANHVKREVWDFLNESIYKLYPDYAEAWEQLKKTSFLITLNMLIMKKSVLNDYCTWLFAILSDVDRHYTDLGIQPNNRYLGYLGECLTTLYLIKNRSWLKFGYTEVQFLKPEENQ